ncbi:NAD(+) diphosphatase [Actinokineospora sp.]|uniref:NAD(+) diphosphatase n=1 Tax=Actinokineospora sp. TaxID=1872133 RepID=UPI0040378B21
MNPSSSVSARDTLPYCGLTLDRAGARRADDAWLRALREHPNSTAIPLWRDRCLVRDGLPVSIPPDADTVFLGLDGAAGVFAADLSELDEPAAVAAAAAESTVDLRRLFPTLPADHGARLAYARGLLHWHRNQRFCGACGAATRHGHGGHQLVCTGCAKLLFARIEPAVIVLVESGRRCLLGRHRGAAENAYATLAGFVEIGENLEDAVRRELAEEAGVAIGAVEYRASQAWPFPSGLMIGFRAVALSEDITVDRDELLDARWFTRAEVAALQAEHRAAGTHRGDSIEQFLLRSWLGSDLDP